MNGEEEEYCVHKKNEREPSLEFRYMQKKGKKTPAN